MATDAAALALPASRGGLSAPVAWHGAAVRRLAGVAVLVLLVLACVLRSAAGTRLDSFTVDEPWHIVAGTSYVRTGDFHLNPEHPPLVKLWTGAAMPADFRLPPFTHLEEKAQERTWVEEAMFVHNDAARAQARARAAMWTFHGSLLLALGLLLWRAGGWAWGAGTLAFLALEPTVGAHLPVVMTDLPLALTFAIATVTCGLLAATWRWRWAVASGVAFGLMLGAKHSALAALAGLVAVLMAAALVAWWKRGVGAAAQRLLKIALAGVLGIVLLWAQYGFHFHAAPDGSDGFNRPLPDKIAEVGRAPLREAIALADRWQVLPRAYLWGLADTVRTGLDGRGIPEHFVWGTVYEGHAPWFAWPAIVAAKLPLPLAALALAGCVLAFRRDWPRRARWTLVALAGASGFHLAALMASSGIWGGVRHAMPLLVAAAMLGGAALAWARRRRSRPLLGAIALLLGLALATTWREPRLWEYHNELAGGSAGAYGYFANEGLDLGQRFGEIRAFHDRVIAPGGLPLYSDYWMGEVQTRAAGLNYHRRVESLDDTNVGGVYEGWFLYPRTDTLPWPSHGWDPKEVFRELTLAAQFGNVGVWRGRQVRPRTRASSLYYRVSDYIYKEDGSDWALVARRLEEVAKELPGAVHVAVELGNAYQRLGNAPAAIAAYRRPLDQQQMPVDAGIRAQFEAQIARLQSGVDPRTLQPLRNPWLE